MQPSGGRFGADWARLRVPDARRAPATGSTPQRPMRAPRLPLLPALVAALVLSACGGSAGAPEGPINVVLVTLDTTRADFLGAWGRAGDPTPNLDRLAAEGVRFANAVSTSAVTPVSHASILTGRTQERHGLRILAGAGGFRLPEDVPTFATTFKARGYATAAIHSAFPVSSVYGFDRGFDLFEEVVPSSGGLDTKEDGSVGWDVSTGQRRSDVTTDRVLEFLAATDEPFFLWIHYWDPHDYRYFPPREFIGDRVQLSDQDLPVLPDGRPRWDSETYGLEISYVDQEFGRVLDALRADGRYDRTAIAVVADHGEGMEDGFRKHGWGAHRILYQEQIHVPLILRIPGASSGKTVERLVSAVDILPTVLDYLDVAPEGELGGRSLRPLMEGDPDAAPSVYAYADQINLWDANAKMLERRPQADFLHVLMDDEWKLIYRPRQPETSELYAYRTDVDEQQNLFGERREVSRRMLIELARRDAWVLAPPAAGGEGMSEAQMKALGNLGYTEGGVELSPEEIAGMWRWLCPETWHYLEEPGPCPEHGTPTLPARRP